MAQQPANIPCAERRDESPPLVYPAAAPPDLGYPLSPAGPASRDSVHDLAGPAGLASFPSAGRAGAPQGTPPARFGLSALFAAFSGSTPAARERAAQRWAHQQQRLGLAARDGKGWQIQPRARLPDGRTAAAFLQTSDSSSLCHFVTPSLPAGHEHWTDRQRQRFLDSHELIRLFNDCRREASNDETAAMLLATRHGEWAQQRGLPTRLRSLYRIQRRLDPNSPDFDGNIRRSCRGEIRSECDPGAWDFFKSLWLDPRRRSVALCWEVTRIEANKQKWSWPALRTIQQRVRDELPPFLADRLRLGQRRWAQKHAPRIERDLSGVRPNECWIGDHRQFDFLVLYKGKPIRPWLTAWEDQRSRLIVGYEITAQPNSDTILSAFRSAVIGHGAPLRIIIDNGKDYRAKSFSGGRQRKPPLDEQRVKSVCARLGIGVTFCEPFNPGSKAIESFFDTVQKRFDRLFDSYCGSDPQDRPEDLYRRLKAGRVELPLLADLPARFGQFLDAYHRRPHSGDAMDGLCPLDAWDQFDPIAKRTAPSDLLDVLLRKTVEATVTRRGVRLGGVHYGQANRQLWQLQGGQVLLRLDPEHADRVEVCDLEGRHLTWALNERIRGRTPEEIAEGRRRYHHARRLAKQAAPALRQSRKTIVEHVIAAQHEQAEQLRQAVGAEVVPAQRDLALLPATIEIVAPPTDSAQPPPLSQPTWEEAPEEPADEPASLEWEEEIDERPTSGELLRNLEVDDGE